MGNLWGSWGSGRSLVYKLTGRLNYGVEPLRCGRRLIRIAKKQTNAAKRPVGVRMAACKEGSGSSGLPLTLNDIILIEYCLFHISGCFLRNINIMHAMNGQIANFSTCAGRIKPPA